MLRKAIYFEGGFKIKVITINIPNIFLDLIQTQVDLGFMPSRSEAIRQALGHFLKNEKQMYQDFEKYPKIKETEHMLLMHIGDEYNCA